MFRGKKWEQRRNEKNTQPFVVFPEKEIKCMRRFLTGIFTHEQQNLRKSTHNTMDLNEFYLFIIFLVSTISA